LKHVVYVHSAFLGPTIGGVLVDKFEFPWASTAVACMLLLGVSTDTHVWDMNTNMVWSRVWC